MKRALILLSICWLPLFLAACPHHRTIVIYNNSHDDLILMYGNNRKKLDLNELIEIRDWRSHSEKEKGKILFKIRVIQNKKERSYSLKPEMAKAHSVKGSPVSQVRLQFNQDLSLQVMSEQP